MFQPKRTNMFSTPRNPTPPGLVALIFFALGTVAVVFACNAIFYGLVRVIEGG